MKQMVAIGLVGFVCVWMAKSQNARPRQENYGCYRCDYDRDEDVDLADFAVFARCMGGSQATDEGICKAGDGMGDTLRLCHVWTDDAGRLTLEWERPVANVWYEIMGDHPMVELWTFRDQIGNPQLAQTFWPSLNDEINPWCRSFAQQPGYVAVRITGQVMRIEDVVYDEGDR